MNSCADGLCVPKQTYCVGREFYRLDSACCTTITENALDNVQCIHCKECQEEASCTAECGVCIKKGASCGPGMVTSDNGACTDTDNCKCCKPDPVSCLFIFN